MVTKEEFGQLIAEFESFRDMLLEETEKIKTDIERLKDDFDELKKDLMESSKVISKKRLG